MTPRLRWLFPVVSAILAVFWLLLALRSELEFDDAYMAYRYASSIMHGHGISWNPGDGHTYGMTGQLWVGLVLLASFLPVSAGPLLQGASWATGVGAMILLALCVRRHSQSKYLRRPSIVIGLVTIPLLINPVFAFHLTSGMDTMLSLLSNVALASAVVSYSRRPSLRQALMLGGCGVLAVWVRPDNVLCALGAPLLSWLFWGGRGQRHHLLGLIVLPMALIAVEMLVCRWYFGVPLPLSFYMKSLNNYAGFQNQQNAVRFAAAAALCAAPFVAMLVGSYSRGRHSLVLALLVPSLLTVCYLLTVRQTMGNYGRYYVPLLPFLVLPSLLALDDVLVRGLPGFSRVARAVAATAVVYLVLVPFEQAAEQIYRWRMVPAPIPLPALRVTASAPLPQLDWFVGIRMASHLAAALPAGAVVAASEVGYLGWAAPTATVVDLVGLNDTHIARRGFEMDYLLMRAPDLIWLPHSDYTGLRAQLLSDPRFLARYLVIKDALNYGVAIRRDSGARGVVEHALATVWPQIYPGYAIDDYVVRD